MLSFDRPIVTLRDLQTDHSLEDLYKLLEIGLVNAHNSRAMAKLQEQRQRSMQARGG